MEALAHLSKALALLDTLPESVDRDRKELSLRIGLTTPLIAAKGMAAPEMRETITRARTLCERLGDLKAEVEAFVDHYNHQRYHESLKNLTPADVYFGRGQTILLQRERINRKTFEHWRLQHARAAA